MVPCESDGDATLQFASSPLQPERDDPIEPFAGYALALAASAVAAFAAAAAERWLGLRDPSVVFMLAVLLVAVRTRTGPALAAAMSCFLAYNFFFIEPRYTLHVEDRSAMVLLALFLVAAGFAGRLASSLAMQVQALRRAQTRTATRQRLALQLSQAESEAQMTAIAADALRDAFGADAWLRTDARANDVQETESASLSVLRRSGGDGRPNSHRETAEQHGWWFLPLRTADHTFGAVGLKFPAAARVPDAEDREAVREMVHDLAQALHRLRLATALQDERVRSEAERLRSALLSSVSHDLRTPLAAILGAAESLERYGDAIEVQDRGALLAMIRSESERLDRYIRHLLDMTRLGPGAPPLRRDWIGVDELLGAVLGRMRRQHPAALFQVDIDPTLLPIHVQPALLEQALFNIIENAATFSPAGSPIRIRARHASGQRVCIAVTDRGAGIPAAERAHIFDMFYSVARGDRGRDGTGLGLAISRAAIIAHGGEIEADAGTDGVGTEIRVWLHADEAPERAA
jgi:two-component system sensor histidine kinase KdpD